jgi:hypothetical protein
MNCQHAGAYPAAMYGYAQRIAVVVEADQSLMAVVMQNRLGEVRLAIHRHGGRAWAEARVGAGAFFQLAL